MAKNNAAAESNRPDFENGVEGNQGAARLALYDQIADQSEAARAEDLVDITDEMYLNPAGTGEEVDDGDGAALDVEIDAARAADEVANDITDEIEVEAAPPPVPTIKVNGEEIPLTADLIARTQKVAAADAYLAEASRIYRESTTLGPSADAHAEDVDEAALARAIQLGTEDEAIAAIKQLRASSLPPGEIEAIVERKLAAKATLTDVERFNEVYKDLLADQSAREAIWAFDAMYANDGVAPTFERFEKAAKAVQGLRGTPDTGMTARIDAKNTAPRPVVANGQRRAAPPPEPEETPRDVIAQMAAARGQSLIMGGR